MKITKAALRRIIKEEISKAVKEELSWDPSASMGDLDAHFPTGVDAIPDKQQFMKEIMELIQRHRPDIDPATAMSAAQDAFRAAFSAGRSMPSAGELADDVLSGEEPAGEEDIAAIKARYGLG